MKHMLLIPNSRLLCEIQFLFCTLPSEGLWVAVPFFQTRSPRVKQQKMRVNVEPGGILIWDQDGGRGLGALGSWQRWAAL